MERTEPDDHLDAVTARRRRWWLLRQAEESTTFREVLAGLAQDRRAVTLQVAGGQLGPFALVDVGTDYVEVPADGTIIHLVALRSITRAAAAGRAPLAPRWARPPTVGGLVERLHRAAADHPLVELRSPTGVVVGTLRSVGRDLAIVHPADHSTVYVVVSELVEVRMW